VGDVGGRAAGHLLAVDGRGQVDLDVVTLLGGPLHGLERGEALPQPLDLVVDLAVGDLKLVDADLDGGEVGQRDLGPHVDLGGELERLAVLDLREGLQLRPAEHLHVVLADRGQDLGRDGLLHGLVDHGGAPDPLVDHGRRHLAAAEPGDLDLLANLPVRLLEARLKLDERHLDGEPHPRRAQGLDGALHRRTPRWIFQACVPCGVARTQ
jgi:hypothetical protein